jgi:hypothetical protein
MGVFVGDGTLPMEGVRRPSRRSFAEASREGRDALGGAVLTVGVDSSGVESDLVDGRLACPDCGGVLWPWGWARRRVLRDGWSLVVVRPRRARCSVCGVSHVLLPVFVLARRADLVEVIGAALVAKAAGMGSRVIGGLLRRPADTVRGWLRRFASKSAAVRVFFTALLVGVGIDPVPPAAAGSSFADAVASVLGARASVVSRWPGVGAVSPWRIAAAVSNGRLLLPSWP